MHRNRKQKDGSQELGEGEEGWVNGYSFSLGRQKSSGDGWW